ncbi:hypothetical protein P4B35_11175 [Pontiellaceae bacterium B12227]|nr:hypothetical protein [Pontiellaceae bacterium B12227]
MSPNSEPVSETFGLPRFMKGFFAFGCVFFALCALGSVVLYFYPSLSEDPTPRWVWIVCAVIHATFAPLIFLIWRKRNDYVEVTADGVVGHSDHALDVMMGWDEIVMVEDFMQGQCLKLRSADGRTIRAEYQFGNMPNLLNLLERNLPYPENTQDPLAYEKHTSFYAVHLFTVLFFGSFAAWACLQGHYWGMALLLFTLPALKAFLFDPAKVSVEPSRISIRSILQHREIEFANISDTRLELTSQSLLTLTIHQRGSEQTLKLAGFKNIFHLHRAVRNRLG